MPELQKMHADREVDIETEDQVPVTQFEQLPDPAADHVPALQMLLQLDCKVDPEVGDQRPALQLMQALLADNPDKVDHVPG